MEIMCKWVEQEGTLKFRYANNFSESMLFSIRKYNQVLNSYSIYAAKNVNRIGLRLKNDF